MDEKDYERRRHTVGGDEHLYLPSSTEKKGLLFIQVSAQQNYQLLLYVAIKISKLLKHSKSKQLLVTDYYKLIVPFHFSFKENDVT